MELKEKEWDWDKFIDAINGYKRIFVTGPQRSGTRIAAFTIADYLHYYILYSGMISNNFHKPELKSIEFFEHHVTHCPNFSHQIHELRYKDTLVVWLDRCIDEVIKSEKKINWQWKYEKEEQPKYLDVFSEYEEKIKSFKTNWEMKTWFWNNVQKDSIKVDCVVLPYRLLNSSKHFIQDEDRKKFRSDQITQKYVFGVKPYLPKTENMLGKKNNE